MRSLLVTGGAGFIGANFVRHWTSAHPADRVVVVDALTYAGNRGSLASLEGQPCFRFVHGDICDEPLLRELFASERVTHVVHFAAESHVDRSIEGPDEFIRTNVVGTHVLLKVARASWQSEGGWAAGTRFHHVSTDEVYGSLAQRDPAFTESTPYSPNSPYSASKAGSDHLVRAYHHTFGMPVTTSNCSNNYGPYQFPEKLIPLMIANMLRGRQLPIYGKGENVRDWLYVEDHCRAIESVLLDGRAGEVYNVGGGNEWRNVDIVRLLCRMLDARISAEPKLVHRYPHSAVAQGRTSESLIEFVVDRPGHDLRYAIDSSKIERELGFRPEKTFESGIALTLDWYLANETWWTPLLSSGT